MAIDVIPFPSPLRDDSPRQHRTIGEILLGLGRISEDDVALALAYQRDHGGYFGDALVAMGTLTRSELKWALADQFDLPFVQLHPDAIDRSVAAVVPAAWARQHLILPVLRSGDTVTVVLDSPGDMEKLDEIRRFTGAAHVEAALSSPEAIHELINAVHGAHGPPVPLARLATDAVEAGAKVLGVSVRPGRAAGWYGEGEGRVSRPLGADWEAELEALVSPLSPPSGSPVHGVRCWPALLLLEASTWRVECHALGRGDALEWTAHLRHPVPTQAGEASVEPETAAALRAALQAGPVLVRVHPGEGYGTASAEEIVEAALAALPSAVFGPEFRALHLSDRPVATAPGQLYLLIREPVADALAKAQPFALQGLTLDVDRLSEAELQAARRVAPFVALRVRTEDSGPDADFDLRLRLAGDGPLWSQ